MQFNTFFILLFALGLPGLLPALHAEELIERIPVVGRRHAALSETRVPVEVFDRDQIELRGGRNLADVLATIPGVQVRPGIRGSSLFLQGLDGRYVLVLVNGQRVTGRIAGQIDLTRYPIDNIERIEIMRGPSSAIHGSDAIGGVINIITRRRPGFNSEADLRLGSLNHQALHLTTQVQRSESSLSLDLGASRRDAYSLTGDPLRTDGAAYEQWNIAFGFDQTISSNWDLIIAAGHTDQKIERIDRRPSGAVLDQSNDVQMNEVLIKPIYRPHLNRQLEWSLHLSDYWDDYRSDQRGATVLDTQEKTHDRLVDAALHWYEGLDRHDLAMGLELADMELRSDRVQEGKVNRQRLGLFAQNQWSIQENLVLVPGLRFDHDSQFESMLTSKLALRWRQAGHWQLGYSEGYRAPDFKELYLIFDNLGSAYRVEGNPDLKPELSRHIHLSWSWNQGASWSLSSQVYQNRIQNLISVVTRQQATIDQPSIYSYGNIQQAQIRGFETAYDRRWSQWLQTNLSYQYLHARNLSDDRWLENRSPHSGILQMIWYGLRPETSLHLLANASGKKPFYDGDELTWTTALVTYQAHMMTSVSANLRVYAGGQNLSNQGDPRYLPIEPRSYYAGIKAQL